MLASRLLPDLPGLLLAFMALMAIGHALAPAAIPAWPAGMAAWIAAALLWPRLSRSDRLQSRILAGLGAVGIALGVAGGQGIDPDTLFNRNHALLAMLAAVSYLRVIGMPATGTSEPPRGAGAFFRTMLGMHVFGASINMSAVFIIADRLVARKPMAFATAVALSRCFTCGAMYSPFFAAMGVVLLYVPDASFGILVATGLPIAAFCLIYAVAAAWLGDQRRLADFEGYPLTLASLWVPLTLALGVLTLHLLLPDLSVLTVITMLAPALVVGALLVRDGRRHAVRAVSSHTTTGLAQMGSLLALFLSAGVLATGIDAALAALDPWLPFERFGVNEATATLVGMSALAAVGIHPLILVAALTAWLAPVDPAPDLLASIYLLAWGIGGALNPLSGTHIAMASRYQVANWRLPVVNAPFAIASMVASYFVLKALHEN